MQLSLETTYLVGPGGVRVVWADGSQANLRARTTVRFERPPLRVTGRLIPLRNGHVTVETPEGPG